MLLVRLGGAEGPGRIRGTVQRVGASLAEQRIMLIRFGPGQEVQRTPGQTDAQGHFLFENLDTGAQYTYFVGVRSADQLHRSEPVVLDGAQTQVDLVVNISAQTAQGAAAPAAPSPVHIPEHLMAIVARDGHLEVREVIKLVNASPTPYLAVPAQAGRPALAFVLPLPRGYTQLSQLQGLTMEAVRLEPSGLYYTAPLPPGEHRVMYTYTLPQSRDLATILVERTIATAVLEVLVDDQHLVTTSDLAFGGRVPLESYTFVHFRGTNLAAQSRSWLQLVPRQASPVWVHLGAYGVTVGCALLGIVWPLVGWGRRQRVPQTSWSPEERAARRTAGRHLLYTLARLDQQYAAGRIAEAVYQTQRQSTKAQLVALVEQVREAQDIPADLHSDRTALA